MKCPHCLHDVYLQFDSHEFGVDGEAKWGYRVGRCPNSECQNLIVIMTKQERVPEHVDGVYGSAGNWFKFEEVLTYIRPMHQSRPLPPEVPPDLKEEFNEAVEVLSISPKSSAALSRRCLQNLLQNFLGIKGKRNLSEEIDAVIDSKKLTSSLEEEIDAIRTIGNFAAHPSKSQQTGLIVDVEPGEAEWNLDVLEDLFDHIFVKEAKRKKRIGNVNQKLKEAGKPPLKGSTS